MPHEVILKGPVYRFQSYSQNEAKQLGIIDSFGREGTHAPISTVFEHGEGKILADWLGAIPDAILVSTGRHQLIVYRPKSKVVVMEEDGDERPAEAACGQSRLCEPGCFGAIGRRQPRGGEGVGDRHENGCAMPFNTGEDAAALIQEVAA